MTRTAPRGGDGCGIGLPPLWERPELRRAAGETLRPGGLALTDRAAALAGLRPGWPVLDVGAGLGATTAHLRRRYGAVAVGVEPSAGQLALRAAATIPMLRARAEALPVADASQRMVLCECVLSVLHRPARAVAELARVLAPGGWLAVSDLYLKDRHPGGEASRAPGQGCAGGAMAAAPVCRMMEEAGFELTLFEDHTTLLKELAARLILAGGSPCAAVRPGCGYYLLMARKTEDDHA
jgi:SAM-dependent methyltransferase